MIQVAQKLNLAKRALRVHVIVERVRYLLDCNHLVGLRVEHWAVEEPEQNNQSTIQGTTARREDEKAQLRRWAHQTIP